MVERCNKKDKNINISNPCCMHCMPPCQMNMTPCMMPKMEQMMGEHMKCPMMQPMINQMSMCPMTQPMMNSPMANPMMMNYMMMNHKMGGSCGGMHPIMRTYEDIEEDDERLPYVTMKAVNIEDIQE